MTINLRAWLIDPRRQPLVMGVLNATPDSFSDGGQFNTLPAAIEHARRMIEAGADLLDIGGESTRPGSSRVDAHEQIRRTVPIIAAIRQISPIPLSIDTTSGQVSQAALDAGADLINDISAGRDDPGLLDLAAARRVPVILMHMQGAPADMQQAPHYLDVVAEVGAFLLQRSKEAQSRGIDPADVLLDPGIGFGKSARHNLQLLQRLAELAAAVKRPLVLGASRKRFIGQLTGEADASQRLFGTAATVAWGVANGAAMVRVHDVGPMVQIVRMIRAIQSGGGDLPQSHLS